MNRDPSDLASEQHLTYADSQIQGGIAEPKSKGIQSLPLPLAENQRSLLSTAAIIAHERIQG